MDMSSQSWVISVLVCLTFAHLTQSTRPIRYISCEYQHCDGRTQYCDKLTGSCSGCRAPCSRTTEADEKLCQTECQVLSVSSVNLTVSARSVVDVVNIECGDHQTCDGRTEYCDRLTDECVPCWAPCSRTTGPDVKLCQKRCARYLELQSTTPKLPSTTIPTGVIIHVAASKSKSEGHFKKSTNMPALQALSGTQIHVTLTRTSLPFDGQSRSLHSYKAQHQLTGRKPQYPENTWTNTRS
ncbi:hypothetical protein NP493_99g01009 [Ridgeia piscesae]|uniref:TNFR-Cys domain-containing protein n=1 Tax=Ridgeia piscesae TaxID=27915 RepID=A0AAD9P7Z1_RIDPI|nr:hypothetical protein NP493_99g01009 [Ridgeia piscesae]